MRVERLDHVHVYVKSLTEAATFFSDLLGCKFVGPLEPPEPQMGDVDVRATFDSFGLEIIESKSPDGFVIKAIEKRGEGLAGVAFKVADLEEAIEELKSKGVRMLYRGHAGDVQSAIFHPKDTHGVLIELVQYENRLPTAIAGLGRTSSLPTPI